MRDFEEIAESIYDMCTTKVPILKKTENEAINEIVRILRYVYSEGKITKLL